MADEPSSGGGFKVAVGWSAVILAIIGGITGGMNWTANHIAEPLVSRLIKNIDFQEENADKNSKGLEVLAEKIDAVNGGIEKLNANYGAATDKTHELQREQIQAAKKAVEVLAVPKKE